MNFEETRIEKTMVPGVERFVVRDMFTTDRDRGPLISWISPTIRSFLERNDIVERDVPAVVLAPLVPHVPTRKLAVAWAHAYAFLESAATGECTFHVLDAEGAVWILCVVRRDTGWHLSIGPLAGQSSPTARVAFAVDDPYTVISCAERVAAKSTGLAA